MLDTYSLLYLAIGSGVINKHFVEIPYFRDFFPYYQIISMFPWLQVQRNMLETMNSFFKDLLL